jgi:hypothetical protein
MLGTGNRYPSPVSVSANGGGQEGACTDPSSPDREPGDDGTAGPLLASPVAGNGHGGGTVVRKILLVLLLSCAGCVTVRSEPPDFTQPWPPPGIGTRPAIELIVTGAATYGGLPRDVGPILGDWVVVTERAYRESALFTDILPPGQRADIRVDVSLLAEVHEYPPLSFLSYLTLFVIPHVVTTEITMTTRVTADRSQPLGTIEVRGRGRTWYQLLLFPFAPFFEPQIVTPEIVYDLNRETISALHARGVF